MYNEQLTANWRGNNICRCVTTHLQPKNHLAIVAREVCKLIFETQRSGEMNDWVPAQKLKKNEWWNNWTKNPMILLWTKQQNLRVRRKAEIIFTWHYRKLLAVASYSIRGIYVVNAYATSDHSPFLNFLRPSFISLDEVLNSVMVRDDNASLIWPDPALAKSDHLVRHGLKAEKVLYGTEKQVYRWTDDDRNEVNRYDIFKLVLHTCKSFHDRQTSIVV